MRNLVTKWGLVTVGIWVALVGGLVSGCASGGYKLTREYARFVNRQSIIIRIILYILTIPVFVITLLIDLVVFNTMDFWDGRVAAGTYRFERDQKTYLVHHRYLPNSQLRESKIEISGVRLEKTQVVLLRETQNKEIEVSVDGHLKARVTDIHSLPKISLYNEKGAPGEAKAMWATTVAL